MKKRINLLNAISIAFIFFTSLNIQAQNPGISFDLNLAINQRLNAGDTNITPDEVGGPGRYRLDPSWTGGADSHIYIANRNNVTIDLTGIEIICTETTRAVEFFNCSNVTVKGLSIDYDPLPYTQARITDISGSTITASIISGYPAATNILQTGDAKVQTFIPDTGFLRVADYYNLSYSINPGANTVTITNPIPTGAEQINDILVLASKSSIRGNHVFYLRACENMKIQNTTIYSGPQFGFFETNGNGNQYTDCKVDRRPLDATRIKNRGVMRMRSVEADAFHSKYATNPSYIRCEARHNADDGIAINGDYFVVIRSDGSSSFRIASKGTSITPNFVTNERINMTSATGEKLSDATVMSISQHFGGLTTAERNFLQSEGFIGDAEGTGDSGTTVWNVTIDGGINMPMGSVVNHFNKIGNGFEVTDCIIEFNRSRGLLIKGSNGTISGNTIRGTWGKGIAVAPEYEWLEAGSSDNVEIRDNLVEFSHDAGIAVFSKRGNNSYAPIGAHNNIRIINNTVNASSNPGIAVTSTSNLCLQGNSVTNPDNSYLANKPWLWDNLGRTNASPSNTTHYLNYSEVSCGPTDVVSVNSISVSPSNYFLANSQQVTLNANINPSNADNQSVTWETDRNDLVTIVNGLVTAHSTNTGTATVIVRSAEDPTIFATSIIEVGNPVDAVTFIDGPSVVVPGANSSVTVNYSATDTRKVMVVLQDNTTSNWVHQHSETVEAGIGSFSVNFIIDETLTNGTDTHRWVTFITTSPVGGFNEKIGDELPIFDVDVDNTAVRVIVDPTSVFLAYGEQRTINATVLNTTNQSVTWSSTNPSVASVNPTTGLVTAGNGIGTTDIIATSNEDPSQTATSSIEVGDPIDTIISTDWPLVLAPATTVPVTVNYSATSERRIFTYLQRNAAPFDWAVSDIRTVSAGTGSFTIDFPLGIDLTVGTDTYQWVTYITVSPDGGFVDNLGSMDDFVNVDNSGVIVTVTPASVLLTVSEQQTLTSNVFGATDNSVTWSIEDGSTDVAIINPTTGVLSAVGNGTVNVVATSNEDPSASGVSSVTVGDIVDAISSVDGPNGVAPGNAVTVSVNYSSTTTQDIAVFLQETTGDFLIASNHIVTTVGPGVSSFNVSVTPLSGLATGSAYRWVAQIIGSSPLIDEFDNPVTVDPDLSVFDREVKAKLLVYPNPAKDILNIVLEEKFEGLTAELIDLSGRLLISKQLKGNRNTLDITSLSDGVYMLFTKDGNNTTSVNKIVVSH